MKMKNKFFCILGTYNNEKSLNFNLFKEAAKRYNLEIVCIEADKINLDDLFDIEVTNNDLLYRIGDGINSQLAELILNKNGISKLSQSHGEIIWSDIIKPKKNNIPIIPMVIGISDDIKKLKKNIASLGGFPIVMKFDGESHGRGVFKANNIEEVLSFSKTLPNNTVPVMKKFIYNAKHIRCVVLGNKVLDAIEYLLDEKDFRTNVGIPNVIKFPYDEEVFSIAIDSVKASDREWGGVDILIDENNNKFLAEVNTPCNFSRNQLYTGTDIAGSIIEFLINKSKGKKNE